MSLPAPFKSSLLDVEKAWIDYNGHMNMAYYNVLFDRCTDQQFDEIGVGADYVKTRHMSLFTAEIHVTYIRELHLGDSVWATFQLIDADSKRLHGYQELYHKDGWLSATCESMSLHVDMDGPKVTPFPPEIQARIGALAATHAQLPRPDNVGRSIGIKRK